MESLHLGYQAYGIHISQRQPAMGCYYILHIPSPMLRFKPHIQLFARIVVIGNHGT